MGAELRIADETLVRQAEELAALRKLSVSEAVAEAVRVSLQQEQDTQERIAKIKEYARELKQHVLHPTESDHSWLYGDDGLPA